MMHHELVYKISYSDQLKYVLAALATVAIHLLTSALIYTQIIKSLNKYPKTHLPLILGEYLRMDLVDSYKQRVPSFMQA